MTKRLKEDLQRLGSWTTSAPSQLESEPVGFRWRRGTDDRWKYNRIDLLDVKEFKENGIEYELLYTARAPEDDYVGMLEEENERLREIERRYRWVEEHLEDFDQLNIPGIEK